MMLKMKTILMAAATFLAVGSANAEIFAVVKEVTGDEAKILRDTPCFVRERTLFGNGGVSPLSGIFSEGGLTVATDKNADCSIVVGGQVTLILNKDNPTFVSPILADWIINNPDTPPDADAAIHSDKPTEQFANEANEASKPKSALGETTGASVGVVFGLAGAAGGAMLGSLFDDKKQLPAGVASIYADLRFKDASGKVSKVRVVAHAASTTKERPADLLRAAVKRVVAEIQAKQDASSNTSASVSVTTKEIH